MYSEFTVKLIEEVKKREILYNTKYDKRPKSEKEKCWQEIGLVLNSDADKCKKHWKNIRDRFVKIKHAREKHFLNNGSELDAPHYIYFEMLSFMKDFSIKKEMLKPDSFTRLNLNEIIPDTLLSVEKDRIVDVTNDFLHLVQEYPILYDKNAEMRQYRDKASWKKISDSLYSRFTIGKLRTYWIMLMRKYKLYEEHRHNFFEPIKNEHIYNQMQTFIRNSVKSEDHSTEYILEEQYRVMDHDEDEEEDDMEVTKKETYEENLESDDNYVNTISTEENFEGTEIVIDQEENIDHLDEDDGMNNQIEEENYDDMYERKMFEPPAAKRNKYDSSGSNSKYVLENRYDEQQQQQQLDEFDYFGRKVALQLRQIARKNRNISRKAEIEVLQLLMECEEHLEKQQQQ